jgi:hypothetical protein
MLKAIFITATSWFIGILFFVNDGQDFTHAVVWIACCIAAAIPWCWHLSRRHGPVRRILAAAVVTLNVAVTVQLAIELPEAWRRQHRWDGLTATATPNQPLPARSLSANALDAPSGLRQIGRENCL